jgi:hypothetical protein
MKYRRGLQTFRTLKSTTARAMEDDPEFANARAKILALPLDVRRELREATKAKWDRESPSETQRKADVIDIEGPMIAALFARGPCTDPEAIAWARSMMLAYGEGINMSKVAANEPWPKDPTPS